MKHLLMPQTKEQAEEFLRLATMEAARFGATHALPQDVENPSKDEMRELFEYVCTHTKAAQFPLGTVTLNGKFHHYTDSDTDSAWIGFVLGYVSANKAHAGRMTGHVRVPAEPTEEMIEAGCRQHECQQQDSWYSNSELSERDCRAIYKAMINAVRRKRYD